MAKVKASSQQRMVVVPYDPKAKMASFFKVLFLLAACALAGYYYGNTDFRSLLSERDQLKADLGVAQTELEQKQRLLTQQEIDASVDKRATNEVREGMASLREEIAELKAEIGFYKGLMAPTKTERGLSIRSLDLLATNNPRRYQFKMVLQQLAVEHNLLIGKVTVSIVGRQAGAEKVLQLSELSNDVKSENIRFRFKYFQNIGGRLALPEGFEPTRIEVVAQTTGKKPLKLEKKFGWITQEV